MILTGEGKLHADNLPDASYYSSNRHAISRTLFSQTSFGLRFTPVILETIKKSHKTLPYILRNQYFGAHDMYKELLDIPKDIAIARNDKEYCYDFFQRIASYESMQPYYKEVFDSLIHPIFRRFGYYSPSMGITVFIGLICILGETYSSQYYGLVWKHFIRDSYPKNVLLNVAYALGESVHLMVRDELDTWDRLSNKHQRQM